MLYSVSVSLEFRRINSPYYQSRQYLVEAADPLRARNTALIQARNQFPSAIKLEAVQVLPREVLRAPGSPHDGTPLATPVLAYNGLVLSWDGLGISYGLSESEPALCLSYDGLYLGYDGLAIGHN